MGGRGVAEVVSDITTSGGRGVAEFVTTYLAPCSGLGVICSGISPNSSNSG